MFAATSWFVSKLQLRYVELLISPKISLQVKPEKPTKRRLVPPQGHREDAGGQGGGGR